AAVQGDSDRLALRILLSAMSKITRVDLPDISSLIFGLRSRRVILDTDLAKIYGVPTKRLNEQLRRNIDRFPKDFAFQLTPQEWAALRSQFATLETGRTEIIETRDLRSQFATSKSGRGGRRYLPYAFTEHGALMAANVLNSPRAVAMSVYVIRAFVKMREELAADSEIL